MVLVIGEVTGVTKEMHDGMLEKLGGPMRAQQGFVAHLAGPNGDGWRVMEVWETKEHATRWFAEHVHPNLPPGGKPKRTFFELHACVVR
jgi:hypothetical protein